MKKSFRKGLYGYSEAWKGLPCKKQLCRLNSLKKRWLITGNNRANVPWVAHKGWTAIDSSLFLPTKITTCFIRSAHLWKVVQAPPKCSRLFFISMEKLISIDVTKPLLKQILYFVSPLNDFFFSWIKHKHSSSFACLSFLSEWWYM